jgi:hypothetical protein
VEKRVAGARREIITGAGHLLNLDAPAEFNRILKEFLQSLPQAEPRPGG